MKPKKKVTFSNFCPYCGSDLTSSPIRRSMMQSITSYDLRHTDSEEGTAIQQRIQKIEDDENDDFAKLAAQNQSQQGSFE
ncbi:hypothetical protein WR25_08175 [Diploscapter pachys]|uniref:Uncharacterized protein n=1 Tax=Diploscapter pachys TaxID=2018661 RepID=A0A2A2KFE4_9BILA|nr:hypothetical protein WR25_08175 [Diploscapter pachys]